MKKELYLIISTLIPQDSLGNTVIGGSTSDNVVSQLSGQKPLVVYVKKGAEFRWTMILTILSYISVSAISFKDDSTNPIALSLETTTSSTDPFNILLITSAGVISGFFTSTNGIKGIIPSKGLKYENSGNFYLAMQHYGTQYFYFLKFGSALSNKNTIFNLKWPQTQTQANAVVNDEQASYYFYGGILKDSGGSFYTAVVNVYYTGAIQQIFTIRNSAATQQFSIKSLDYLQDTSASTRCLAACAEDGQNVLILKLNVNAARSSISLGSSTDINYYASSLNNKIFSGWMDLSQVLYVGSITTFTSEALTTTSFTKNIGWLMNINPSESEFTITNSLSSPQSMTNEPLIYSTLTSTFVNTTATTSYASRTSTSAVTYIVPQILTTSMKSIITPNIGNKIYTIGSTAMIITIPAFTLQQSCLDVIFKYSSNISDVSGFVTFVASTREYTVFSSNQEYNGIYTIKMLGRINNEQNTEVSFKLIMIGDCSYASITSTSYNPTLSSQIGTYNLSFVGILLYPLSDGEINPKNETIYIKFQNEWWEKLFD
ncbi:UNKNOWN [Stylonychia lemnae]|uniref:Uncharacterized protein n=1 Tax=Stylonychia lemnae TaxID=5949 RepID=A0A078AKX2_STYLE|nr:UNKNOWN [Stylonychia lemnae]|eukprot:CDW82849.1 UNKNOWN [Stylonychia lemnae]